MSERKLHLAPDLALPKDAVARTFGVLGQRGTGKTSTAVVLVEEMSGAGAQVAVVDPTGAWWGLRSSADGKGPGVPVVVFGGHEGDVPLEEFSGALIAELLVREGYSVVLDLELLRKGAQVRFMADFTEALYHANREALHLVVDEADRFAPQTLRGGDVAAARALGGLEDIVKLGRRKGLGCTLVTQRPATLNKNVLEQAETLIVHRLIGPRDRKAIAEWFEAQGDVGAEKEALAEISKLKRGSAYVFSPAFLSFFGRVGIRAKRTYDSSATPEVGARARRTPVGRADVDMGALRDRMAATIERAKADDPRELRKRIADLEKQLANPPAPPEPEIVEVPVLTDEAKDALEDAAAAITAAKGQMIDAIAEASALLGGVVDQLGVRREAVPPPMQAPRRAGPASVAPKRQAPVPAPRPAGDFQPSTSQQRILNALAMLEVIGVTAAPKVQLALFAEASPKSSGYTNNLGALRTAGLIDYPMPGTVGFTAAGRAYGDAGAAPSTVDELHAYVRQLVGPSRARILDQLIDVYPEALPKAELAGRAGVSASSSGYTNNLGSLRSLGLIDYPAPGHVAAQPVLFLEGAHA